jgi:hypothetical protein
MLKQAASMRQSGNIIGANVLWRAGSELSYAIDRVTGQRIALCQQPFLHAVTVKSQRPERELHIGGHSTTERLYVIILSAVQ